ncbi:MAG: glutamate-1-semialdehyde 2,1-aminomutase [Candidatus Eiseniibacteriota bacterium]
MTTDRATGAGAGAGPKSAALWRDAIELLPGGVDSPVRAFRAVGGHPVFFEHGEGAYLVDVDGRRYVDLVGSWGSLLLGHAHPVVVEAVSRAVKHGSSFGAPSPLEVELARLVVDLVPGIEQVRFVSSGTEAVMSALRLARAATGRDLVVKFEGSYHGCADSMLVAAGSGALTLGIPDSPGVPAALAALTAVLPYNDADAVEKFFDARGSEVACVIVEPIAANMGVVPPRLGFLEALRAQCDHHGALLVFDEVMTAFRVAPGGAQELYDVTPDLTTTSKVLGGGFPSGAYGGRRDLMQKIAPAGPVYQAGTLNGNPVAMAAGLATLEEIVRRKPWETLEARGATLERGLAGAFSAAGVPVTLTRVGSMGTAFFLEGEASDFAAVKRSDTARFARFHRAMLERGVYLPPSQFEAFFVSTEHDDAVIEQVIEAARDAAREVLAAG